MNTEDTSKAICLHRALSDIDEVNAHLKALTQVQIVWSSLTIIHDPKFTNHIVCLCAEGIVVAVLRLNPMEEDVRPLLKPLCPQENQYTLEVDSLPKSDEVSELSFFQKLLNGASPKKLSPSILTSLFHLEKTKIGRMGRGRNTAISSSTANQVILDAHGRCMFQGCGESLTRETLTGRSGNFSYLAHIVASSADGPRGDEILSPRLSDESNNIMFLCDKHHRLIDKVALNDYPRECLDVMRNEYVMASDRVLDSLRYSPAKAFYISFLINNQISSAPDYKEVAACMSAMGWRLESDLVIKPYDADSDDKSTEFWSVVAPRALERACVEINQTCSPSNNLIFAIGPMPLLIGFGAKIGNKAKFTPVLMNRKLSKWMFSPTQQADDFLHIDYIDCRPESHKDVVIYIALTDNPFQKFCDKSLVQTTFSRIFVTADTLANGVISHPNDGLLLQNAFNSLLHEVKKMNFDRIHLICCASNTACINIGKAFEQNHSNLIVYDFCLKDGVKSIQPVMEIVPSNRGTQCQCAVFDGEILHSSFPRVCF